MKEKKLIYKKWWFWVLVILVIGMIGNAVDPKKPKEEASTAASSLEETKEESKEEPPVEENEPQTTEEKIAAIVDAQHFKYSDYRFVTSPNDDGNISITLHYDDASWNETGFVVSCLTDYINICKEAYTIEGITKVEYYVFCDFTDVKGNPKTEKGFAICMIKENFETYNWDNIKGRSDAYPQIEKDCEYIDIHAGIRKNVNFDKVFYAG